MPTHEELDALPTKELRERAFSRARHHLDVGFFWKLLDAVPAVEAAAGHGDEAAVDIMSLSRRVEDLIRPDTTEEADAFRPLYIEYLLEHDGR
jgi:hypothetical protein